MKTQSAKSRELEGGAFEYDCTKSALCFSVLHALACRSSGDIVSFGCVFVVEVC